MAAYEDRSSPDLDQFRGVKWTDWLTAIQSSVSTPKQQPVPEHSSKRDIEVARLRRADMSLYGYRPATDKFYLVVCECCGQLTKPQSMNMHYERKHRSKRITRPPPQNVAKATHGLSKHSIDRSNHRVLSPPHSSRHAALHRTSSLRNERHNSLSERSAGLLTPEELSTIVEREKRNPEANLTKNHKSEKIATKPISLSAYENMPRFHHSSGRKPFHKPGGTIHLNEIPESHVVKSSTRHSTDGSSKHHQRQHRTSESSAKSYEADTTHVTDHKKAEKEIADSRSTGSKSRKNHDSYHHHYHQAPRQETSPDNDPLSPDYMRLLSPSTDQRLGGTALVVLEKTPVPTVTAGVKINSTHKRSRPFSGRSECSMSPPRCKVAALHNPVADGKLSAGIVPNSAVSTKMKKKTKKILPLKAREYDPNEHCGVWVKEDNSHCRRSLTCKVHPLSAKRAVAGRRKQYGELVLEHGREKQRLKEMAAAPAVALQARPIQTTPALSSAEFAVPSPAPKAATPLSPPICAVVTSHTSLQSPSVPKAKPSVTLFPRIFAAWHVDCWDSDEVIEDPLTKMRNLHCCMQSHPRPMKVFDFFGRRSSSCQVSYNRRAERQLEALSTNIHKLRSKPQKPPKLSSFTPISAATFRDVRPPTQVFSQSARRSKTCSRQSSISSLNASEQRQHANRTNSFQTVQSKTSKKYAPRKLSNLAPPDDNSRQLDAARVRAISEQVSTGNLVRTSSGSSNVGRNSQANEMQSASLFFSNDILHGASPQQSSAGDSFQVTSTSTYPSPEVRNHPVVASQEVGPESSVSKYSLMQPVAVPEHTDGSTLVAHLPNGLHSFPGNVRLKQGPQSVTLSGNIGALTVAGGNNNSTGHQISQTLKNINGNNNFIVQGERISSRQSGAKTKHFTLDQNSFYAQQSQPPGVAVAVDSTFLQNDGDILTNQQSVNTTQNTVNRPYAVQNPNFQDSAVNLDDATFLTQSAGNTLSNEEILRLLCSPTESTEPEMEQIFGAPSGHPLMLHRVDLTQGGSSSANPARTDLGQNFVTR